MIVEAFALGLCVGLLFATFGALLMAYVLTRLSREQREAARRLRQREHDELYHL